jgi:hypothetical protein
VGSRTWKALPWAAALTGTAAAAWAFLRLRAPGPRDDSKRRLDLADPEHAAYLTGIAEAVIRAQRDQEPTDDGRRRKQGMKAALGARVGAVQTAGRDALPGQDLPALPAVPLDVVALHRFRHDRVQDRVLVDVLGDKRRQRFIVQ